MIRVNITLEIECVSPEDKEETIREEVYQYLKDLIEDGSLNYRLEEL